MEGPEGRDHLEAHPYSLGAAGGMGCPYGVTLACVGVWQGAVLSCGLLPADGSLWCPYQTLAISLRWWFLQEHPPRSLFIHWLDTQMSNPYSLVSTEGSWDG